MGVRKHFHCLRIWPPGAAVLRRTVCLLALLALGNVSGQGQDKAPPGLNEIPFRRWAEAGERSEIPWKVRIGRVRLSIHQRLRSSVIVTLDGRKLQKSSVERELFLVVRLAAREGGWYPAEATRDFRLVERLDGRTDVQFVVSMFVRPGDYSAAVVLYDRVTGERSVALRRLRVKPVSRDPLRGTDPDLPVVEFIPLAEGADSYFLPSIEGRLRFPVETKRPVQVEILANFSASTEYTGSRVVHSINLSILLPILKLFSGIQLANGSVTITALDLDRHRVFFQEQNVAQGLDWPRLKEELSTLRTTVVDVRALKGRKESAAFFREVLERRLTAPPRQTALATGGSSAAEEPYRVFIVIGSAILFPRGSDLEPVSRVPDCRCRVYHLRHHAVFSNVWDELDNLMKPLKPRRFDISNPMDFRKALAAILDDLPQL